MNQGPVIDCGVCRLRRWSPSDRDDLVRHANDPEVARNLRERFPSPYSLDDADRWIAFAADAEPLLNFAIEVEGEAAGGIGFIPRQDIERVGMEIGYWLGRSFWGRGVMSAAVPAATEYAFSHYEGLRRVFGLAVARHTASIRVLEKAGYLREGVLRRSAVKEGVVLDQVMMAITDLDPRPPT